MKADVIDSSPINIKEGEGVNPAPDDDRELMLALADLLCLGLDSRHVIPS